MVDGEVERAAGSGVADVAGAETAGVETAKVPRLVQNSHLK